LNVSQLCAFIRSIPQRQQFAEFGRSPDEKLIWIVTGRRTSSETIGTAQIIEINGNGVREIEFRDEQTTAVVSYDGKEYRIALRMPSEL